MLTAPFPIPRSIGLAVVFGLVTALATPLFAQEAPQPPVVQSEMPEPSAPAVSTEAAPTLPAETMPSETPSAENVSPAQAQPAATAPLAAPQQPVAQQPATAETVSEPAHQQTDYSPWGMYLAAHWVVKLVMVSLAFASFVTWTVLVFKMIELAIARARARRSVKTIHAAQSLESASAQLSKQTDPAAFMAQAALIEYRRSDPAIAAAGPDGVKERTRSVLDRVEIQAGSRIRRGTGLLATIGATAPFVGLFGTVWGIMNSFIGIAETKTTNLAVVAPGIAEALLATAIGLVAAIPAVVIYNHFTREIAAYRQSLGDAAAGVERLLSRDLDFRHLPKEV
ncbi:tonB-system energizer ExbB [Cypionkella sp.]|uniref:tonB-system energizer ExbB n=1 Tax=Cypionkella sp. TaxID=2811411 RepID=UPI0026241ACE|nr:tonB-system energizer ExbB [Cypionkella sp.]MDB5665136.1 exbB [Cypionkella sp.]